jgi:hypothetical protein
MTDRHYTEPVDEISGTVESASPGGITLKEYPGRHFQFSSVSTSAADMSARILDEKNDMTRCLRPAGNTTPRAPAPEAPCLRSHAHRKRQDGSFINHAPAQLSLTDSLHRPTTASSTICERFLTNHHFSRCSAILDRGGDNTSPLVIGAPPHD